MRLFCLWLFASIAGLSQPDPYNAIYRGDEGTVFTAEPNAFLVEMSRGRKPGKALDEAKRKGVKMAAQVATFETFDFGESRWDLIVLTYEPTKALAPKVIRALKPGGAVIVEDRRIDTRRVWPAGSFADNELIATFATLRVIRYEDLWAHPDWSAKGVQERLVRLCAEKPLTQNPGCVWEGKPVAEGATACWGVVGLRCASTGWDLTRQRCAPER